MTHQEETHAHLEAIVKHLKDLPTLPEVAQELLTELDDDESSLESISEKIAMDQAITAKVLKLANSSHFGVNSRVVTIQQATAMLGVQNIKNLIRLTIMVNRFPVTNCPGFDFRAFWRHGIATANCAELISRALHMKHDFAFTAGLLHDIGRLVLVTHCPAEYAEVIRYRNQNECELLEAERHILDVDHIEAGVVLAHLWNFSDAVQDAIKGHHNPDIPGINALASVVHVANVIVHALDLAQQENELVPLLSAHAWDTLGLNEADYIAIFKETEMRFEALNQIFI
ncbi:HDOD domain-containing protein [Undibacterium jejuense]|uniref:HDOD domain-containing protein n=1 Tax=Undibacterium jejuense TaxID=1344949 RepID=A0A923KJ16_9BURK|nr:HDOD domain-containing protein [Undibacterium jejuense]MBC3863607.1 HDOD domain-containing protein [Undibacterium jejuense]